MAENIGLDLEKKGPYGMFQNTRIGPLEMVVFILEEKNGISQASLILEPHVQIMLVIVGNIGMAIIGFRQMVLNLIVKVCNLFLMLIFLNLEHVIDNFQPVAIA